MLSLARSWFISYVTHTLNLLRPSDSVTIAACGMEWMQTKKNQGTHMQLPSIYSVHHGLHYPHVKWWSTIKWSTKPAQLSLPRSQQHILEQCYPPQSSPRVRCRGRPSPRPWSRPGQLGAARRRVELPALEPGNADGNRAGSQGMLQGNPSPKMARFYFLDCPSLLGHVPRVQCQEKPQVNPWCDWRNWATKEFALICRALHGFATLIRSCSGVAAITTRNYP